MTQDLGRFLDALLASPRRRLALGLATLATVAGIAYGPWLTAQARAVVVLSTTIETPVLTWVVEKLTDEPRVDEISVAGVPTTLARPGEGEGPWPVFVFVNGATARGREHPDVQRLARGLSRAGHVVLVPDLPGLREGAITESTVAATVEVARAAADRADARDGQVGLVGVSVGATLALLAAEDPRLADRVFLVSGIAPFTDLVEVIRLATTGVYLHEGEPILYPADPFVGVAVARSVTSGLAPGFDRDILTAEALAIDRNSDDPFAHFRTRPTGDLGPVGTAVVELFANEDPGRFDELYGALPLEVQAAIERLSPLERANRLDVRVELASAPQDKYFPPEESRALVRSAPNVRLTLTEAFGHAIPRPSLDDPGDLFRFDGWAVRSLRAAR